MSSEDKGQVKEGENAFPDLCGERKKSAKFLLKEAFDEELQRHEEMPEFAPSICLQTAESEASSPNTSGQAAPAVPVKFRGMVHQPPSHDLFGDVVQHVFQQLIARNCPIEVCHKFAMYYVTELDKEMEGFWKAKFYADEIYETEGTAEAKKVFVLNVWPFFFRLLLEADEATRVLTEKWTGIYISADQLKGRRPKQEDRFVAYPNGTYLGSEEDETALLAVFDGHGGSECAHYAASHFWEEWLAAKANFGDNSEKTLISALEVLDKRMTKRSDVESWKGGTTAVCCAVDMTKKLLSFAWLGDSPGYVMKKMEVQKVTRDHSPSDPLEAVRIEEAGGHLFMIGGELRVNGVLNLTRALGDVSGRPMISNVPDTNVLPISDEDYLVILACDGISDVFTTRQLYMIIEAFVEENSVDEYADLAEHICKEAIDAGSNDNVTVVIGFIRPPQELWQLFNTNSPVSSVRTTSSDDGLGPEEIDMRGDLH